MKTIFLVVCYASNGLIMSIEKVFDYEPNAQSECDRLNSIGTNNGSYQVVPRRINIGR